MSDITLTFRFSNDVSLADQANLRLTLEVFGDVDDHRQRIVGELTTLILVLKAIAAGAGAATALIKLAAEINKWRRDLKARKIKVVGEIHHPSLEPLKLGTATDEEVEKWLLRLQDRE